MNPIPDAAKTTMAVGSSHRGRSGRTATTTHASPPTTAATAAGPGWAGGGSLR